MSRLRNELQGLLSLASEAYIGTPHRATVDAIRARLDEPLRVAIAGKVKAGKSTLLNALVGERLAPTDAGECTKVVTWYRHGHTYRVDLHGRDGSVRQAPFHRQGGKLDIDLGGTEPAALVRIEVSWSSDRLRDLTLIDTPGLGSLSTDVGERSRTFLALDDDAPPTEADAVIYLMRHMHSSDLDFLEAFHDDDLGRPTPANAITVLSRADEIGSCRVDALAVAARVASRLAAEPRLRRLSQTVVPVAGLLAEAALTLTEEHHRALTAVAALPHAEADDLLLTGDRFLAPEVTVLPLEARQELVDRFGLFGIRTSVSLIRLGAAGSAGALAQKLRARSGIETLRSHLLTLFTERRDVLKARAALTALDALVRESPPPDAPRLAAEIERVTAGAHELVEVELLQVVRSGRIRFRDDETSELDRLYSRIGGDPRSRLGMEDADADAARAAIAGAADRWRRRAESPLASPDLRSTAHAVTRTYEGMLGDLDRPG